MKKNLLMLAAILCCAMIVTIFTACGGDDDDNNTSKPDDNTPKSVMLVFSLYATADMVDYCDVQVSIGNEKGDAKTMTLKKSDMAAFGANFEWKQTLAADLPVTFTFTRKVTLKQNIDNLEQFAYTKSVDYKSALYNAAGNMISSNTPTLGFGKNTATGKTAAERINSGALNEKYIFSFDKDGKLTFTKE